MKASSGFLLVALAGCSIGAPDTGGEPASSLPPPLRRLVADGVAPADDVVEVWVCRVPETTTAPIYGDLPLRLPLRPRTIVDRVGERVAEYWREVSGGRYEMTFTAGGVIDLADDDDDAECLSRALDRSSVTATVVLAVADAEHTEGHAGGRGAQGNAPNCDGCAAAATRRGVSIGASDFHPDWGAVPLLDLIEHELGHTLGLPHSGEGFTVDTPYPSDLDVMSNSAAPRADDPGRRDAPSTLAINLVDLGWLELDGVVVLDASDAGGDGSTVTLAPITAFADRTGPLLAVLPVDEHRMITIEYRTATGLDAHLPESGVAVHLVDDSTGMAIERSQVPLGSRSPHTDLLTADETLVAHGWSIEVLEVGTVARLAIRPTDR